MGSWLNCNSCSILLTIPLAANLARSTAGELTLELTALLALRARVVLAGERLRLRVAGVVVTASAPAPHPALHPRHQQVQGGGVLDGSGLVERSPPDTVIHRTCGRVGGSSVQVNNVAALGGNSKYKFWLEKPLEFWLEIPYNDKKLVVLTCNRIKM